MIASLKGKVTHKGENFLLLETSGVGYKVFSTPDVLAHAALGHELFVFIYHHVSESAQVLYGFPTMEEIGFFELLLGVAGIGPKVAFNILSGTGRAELERAILREDHTLLSQFPGVGKRLAERLIVELRDKITSISAPELETPVQEDVYSALVSLGYSRQEARQALAAVPAHLTDPSSKLKEALRVLGKT
jgi:Holliday junction DNA helicase RuvA